MPPKFDLPSIVAAVMEKLVPEVKKFVAGEVERNLADINATMIKQSDRLDEMETTMKQIVQKLDQLHTAFDKFSSASDRSTATEEAVFDDHHANTSNLPTPAVMGFPEFCELVKQSAQLQPKSRYAVIEKLPFESEDDDRNLIEAVLTTAKIPVTAFVRCFRHGRSRVQDGENSSSQPGRPRILKVEFQSTASRDQFIRSFRQSLPPPVFQMKPAVFARRDMIDVELRYQSQLRKEVFRRNQEAGLIKFFYRDLRIYACREPYRPFLNNFNTSKIFT